MAERKRNRQQRENDLARIARLYLAGVRQSDIAAELGVSQQQVSYDLKELQRRWQETALADIDEAKRRELRRIDLLEREYWAAWEQSQAERVETHTGRTAIPGRISGGKTEKPTEQTRVVIRKVKRDGNPAFLSGVQSCVDARCRIVGLYAPTRNEHTGRGGAPIAHEHAPDLSKLSLDDLLTLKQLTQKAQGHGRDD